MTRDEENGVGLPLRFGGDAVAVALRRRWGSVDDIKGNKAVDLDAAGERPRRILWLGRCGLDRLGRVPWWSAGFPTIHGHNNGVPFYAPASCTGKWRWWTRKEIVMWLARFCVLCLVFFFSGARFTRTKAVAVFAGAARCLSRSLCGARYDGPPHRRSLFSFFFLRTCLFCHLRLVRRDWPMILCFSIRAQSEGED
ncbi:hypothetical protein [Pandoravirus japonicus]|uniref:Uncharacterized protein n=1 Tax=Pandoravirus japonicus TaxID=2823154 RepID=A0A811BMP5_9VIRU|nr:hypothetical protein [Pandoravirus japonicus]